MVGELVQTVEPEGVKPPDDVIVNCRHIYAINNISFYNLSLGIAVDCAGRLKIARANRLDRLFHSVFMSNRLLRIGTEAAVIDCNDASAAQIFFRNPTVSQTIEKMFKLGFTELNISESYLIATVADIRVIPFDRIQIGHLKIAMCGLKVAIPDYWQPSIGRVWIDTEKLDSRIGWLSLAFEFLLFVLAAVSVNQEGNPRAFIETVPLGVSVMLLLLAAGFLFRKFCGLPARMNGVKITEVADTGRKIHG
jgi:hypothetical protein